jgi:hypothetical protein
MQIDVKDDASNSRTITLDGNTANISAGGNGQSGDVIINNPTGNKIIHLGRLQAGPGDPVHQPPLVRIEINDDAGQLRILLNASTGDVLIGGNGADGDISLKDSKGTNRIQLDGGTGSIAITSAALVQLMRFDGDTGDIVLGSVKQPTPGMPTIQLQPSEANIRLGNNGHSGHLFVNNKDGKDTIHLDGGNADFHMGGQQQAGNLFVNNKDEKTLYPFMEKREKLSSGRPTRTS